MVTDEKVYFLPGDVVVLKQKLGREMIVKGKSTKMIRPSDLEEKKSFLQGITCFWFTDSGFYQEQVFSTKDLIKIEGA